MANKKSKPKHWAASHAEISAAVRKFKSNGGLIRQLPDDFKVQVEAVRFEQSIGNYQGLMEWQ